MPTFQETFATSLRGLGSLEPLTGDGRGRHRSANAHVHLPPNFTAFETTAQAVERADTEGLQVLGASNYYDYTVYAEFAARAGARGIFPLFGIEIIALVSDLVERGVRVNDPGNPGKYYFCGKGITRFDPMTAEARGLLQTIRDSDSERMAAVTDRLAAVFAEAGLTTGLNAEGVKARIVARHGVPPETVYLQERHVAQAFQETLFERVAAGERLALLGRALEAAPKASATDAAAIQNEIRSHLMKAGKTAFVPETFVDFDHAKRLVLALGGLPCYPVLADGAVPLTQYEADVDALIVDLKARGIVAAEFIPTRNSPEVLSRYVRAMREAGLVVSAGTEHNTLDRMPLAPTCLGGVPIPDDIADIFWEGACVIAAHQYRTFLGEPGFGDGAGPSGDRRIREFAELGAAVIARFGDQAAIRNRG